MASGKLMMTERKDNPPIDFTSLTELTYNIYKRTLTFFHDDIWTLPLSHLKPETIEEVYYAPTKDNFITGKIFTP
jgi:hypothetical protein